VARVEDVAAAVAELRARRDLQLVGEVEVAARKVAPLPTGLPALDALLGGGLPLGKVLELAPGPGGAATAIAVRLLAQVTASHHPAALVDRTDAFDARGAELAGVDLERLLWCHPRDQRDALRATDALLASGAFPLVVLDLGARPPAASLEPGPRPRFRERIADAAWLRLARRAEAGRVALVVLAQGGEGAGAFASATLLPERARPVFVGTGPGRTFEGLEVVLRLARNKLGQPAGVAEVVLQTPRVSYRPGE
jgi:RecA/RadA recombinase